MKSKRTKLPPSFYRRDNVVLIARELLGKVLVTRIGGVTTSGRIVETEAYAGAVDKASHAYGGRHTARTSTLFLTGGTAYIYLCYGIHHLFNVVTNKTGVPHAILIRALEPLEGIDTMLRRTGKPKADHTLTRGPGNLSKALGLTTAYTGHSLAGKEIYLADDGYRLKPADIGTTVRIGVDYAEDHAQWPYRFVVSNSPYVSGKKLPAV